MADDVFEIRAKDIDWLETFLLEPLAEAGAVILRDAIVEEMGDAPARTGRTYRIPDSESTYVASAPGEPPAERTGNYLDSWTWEKAVEVDGGVFAFVVNDVVTEDGHALGIILEEGSARTGAPVGGGGSIVSVREGIAPRPHIRPAIVKAQKRFQALIDRAERGR